MTPSSTVHKVLTQGEFQIFAAFCRNWAMIHILLVSERRVAKFSERLVGQIGLSSWSCGYRAN
jgi:hypothetical protein